MDLWDMQHCSCSRCNIAEVSVWLFAGDGDVV